MSTSILHLFFFTCFLLLKMHHLDHILECPIGPSLKVVQLRRLFDWTNMAAALLQFFGAARHPCFEVSGSDICASNHKLLNSCILLILVSIEIKQFIIILNKHNSLIVHSYPLAKNENFTNLKMFNSYRILTHLLLIIIW